ncbi:glycoside hydrolase family 3 protein [Karstenula rhodostoma CBS 690.94]|uniref:beta-glucosidase n=1 Tax=Karstenula rhodostoma CBS 690.94 TaxID=1392251 RepID=A0A9P4PSQ9_9PLEO|nr:glycoside hydrolase family 3 protein [Karstenula rhodostoma CBS 690.94]
MTVEEKALLLAGSSFWETNPIERLGIPRMKASDGPNGARGENFENGVTSACFPASVCLAATFDEELAGQVGKVLGQETKTKGARVLLGPTVCPHRHPTGGRNFESFSEGPLLAGRLATHYIKGLQSQGVGATIKHYAVNEQESNRFTIDTHVSERALREIYLKPFEIAIKNANPWSVMTSYNLVNGTHADANKFLLTEVLRNQWGYKGHVMSDWGGTNSVADSLNAGHDLEMPGPAVHRIAEKIQKALYSGVLSTKTLNERVLANLKLLEQCNVFNDPSIPPEKAIDLPEHRALIRKVGAEGSVLLKNDKSILPLKKDKIRSIAMIGLAKEFLGHGGGSAAVNAHRKITAYEAFEEAVGGSVELKYAEGARIWRNLPSLSESVVNIDGKPGFAVECWDADNKVQDTRHVPSSSFRSFESGGPSRVVMSGTYTPIVSGKHYISFSIIGNTTAYINDDEVFKYEGKSTDLMAVLMGVAKADQKRYDFVAGKEYKIRVEAKTVGDAESPLSFLSDLVSEAEEAAKACDVAILFVGNTSAWETEGCDRDDMNLPKDGSLDKLIFSVAEANPKTIVVNSTGSPISMPWILDVAAVLQAWFPGQEAGYAIADVVFGDATPFGFGLSYTTFENVHATVDIKNVGDCAGSETVQVYIEANQHASIDRPIKELRGYAKAHLAPGEKKTVSVSLDGESFAYVDEASKHWVVEAGKYTVSVGTSRKDIHATLDIEVESRFNFKP